MIRPFTAICMSAAFASGLFLYQTKHQAQMLDRQIMGVLKQTEAARERIGVMKAEWALLNEPERLAELSQKHLGLRTLAPTQFVAVADLGSRLPPPVAPAAPGATAPATDEAAEASPTPVAAVAPAPMAASQAVPSARVAARNPPAASAAAPVQVASAAVRPHAPPEHRVEPAAAARPSPVAPVQMASLPVPAPAPVPPVHHLSAPVVSIGATAIQPPHPPGPVSGALARSTATHSTAASPARDTDPRLAPAMLASGPPASAYQASATYQSAPTYQSALGGARPPLPPPVPYGAAQAR